MCSPLYASTTVATWFRLSSWCIEGSIHIGRAWMLLTSERTMLCQCYLFRDALFCRCVSSIDLTVVVSILYALVRDVSGGSHRRATPSRRCPQEGSTIASQHLIRASVITGCAIQMFGVTWTVELRCLLFRGLWRLSLRR